MVRHSFLFVLISFSLFFFLFCVLSPIEIFFLFLVFFPFAVECNQQCCTLLRCSFHKAMAMHFIACFIQLIYAFMEDLLVIFCIAVIYHYSHIATDTCFLCTC